MAYAQKDYDQKIGLTEETIAESGALIVALANLFDKFGYGLDPSHIVEQLNLNQIDVSEGYYLGIVSVIEPTVSVERRDFGAPFSDNSIVRLEYESSLTGGTVITYAAVESAADKTIIDSYDGEIKQWDVYGEPKAYVTFVDDKATPLHVTPLRAPEKPVAAATPSYTLTVAVPGYASPENAEGRFNKAVDFSTGTYADITDQETGMKKLAPTSEGPGYWINPADNVTIVETELPVESESEETLPTGESEAEAIPVRVVAKEPEAPAPTPEEDTTVPVRVVPKDTDKWKTTWHGYLGPLDYVSKRQVTVKDLEGTYADVELGEGIIHPYAGWFIGPDGKKYFRTKPSVDAGNWYGVPEDALRRHQSDDEFAASLDSINLAIDQPRKGVSKAVEKAGTMDGRIRRFFKK